MKHNVTLFATTVHIHQHYVFLTCYDFQQLTNG